MIVRHNNPFAECFSNKFVLVVENYWWFVYSNIKVFKKKSASAKLKKPSTSIIVNLLISNEKLFFVVVVAN